MPDPDPLARDEDFDARFAAIVEQLRRESEESPLPDPPEQAADSPTEHRNVGDPDTESPNAQAQQATPGSESATTPGSEPADGGAGSGTTPPEPPRAGMPVRSATNPPPVFRPPAAPPPPALDVPVWRGATSDNSFDEILDRLEDEDHFVPPPPRPLPPQEDLHFWGIIIGLVGGTAMLLWLSIFRPDVAQWWLWLSIALIVGGFVLLVLRGGDSNDHDNGAVV